MKLKRLHITVNYPNSNYEAEVAETLTPLELNVLINKLFETETEMISFVISAMIDRN